MLNITPTYSLADISIIPCELTDIESRKECNCMCESLEGTRETLPIVVAPMSCNYTGLQDADIYASEGINVVIPRTVAFEERLKTCKTYMTAFSLKEAESILEYQFASGDWPEKIFMCIDMANGHMKKQVNVGNKLREKFGKSLVLMGGNIANPKTIRYYKNFDYLRVGIGGGAACFVKGTLVTLANGEKKDISDIREGDIIKTKSGNYPVANLINKKVSKTYTINNKVTCTEDHRFFVINKKDKELVNEENLNQFGYYVEAKDLNKDIHLLVKIT
jgi:hypothetical protein